MFDLVPLARARVGREVADFHDQSRQMDLNIPAAHEKAVG